MNPTPQHHPIHGFREMIGESVAMVQLRTLLLKVAHSHASTVLITGESGTGKDLAARLVHQESARRSQQFLTITCTALQESLLDSELFGHEKGSFTDAKAQKRGLLELAHGGTLFLDEVGEMSPGLQAKLLRFLEDRTFLRVGGAQEMCVDVRVIAATNRDLAAEVRAGRFREDLFFRLTALPVEMPPLRRRHGDIALLTDYFQRLFAGDEHCKVRPLTAAARHRLDQYEWPGNVRELRNVMERAVLLCEETFLGPDDFRLEGPRLALPGRPDLYVVESTRQAQDSARHGPSGATPVAGAAPSPGSHPSGRHLHVASEPGDHLVELPSDGVDMAALEQDLVVQAIERTHGNQAMAADLLGMTRDQMRYRVAKLREANANGSGS